MYLIPKHLDILCFDKETNKKLVIKHFYPNMCVSFMYNNVCTTYIDIYIYLSCVDTLNVCITILCVR